MPISLALNDLARMFGRTVFERGLRYADAGAVFSLKQEGNVLRGQVMGNELYQTLFQLIPPHECRCTCPYEGSCKHAAALAITWLRQTTAEAGRTRPIVQTVSLRDQLGSLSEHTLVDLIMDLVDTVSGTQAAIAEWLIQRDMETMGSVPGQAREEADVVRGALRRLLADAPTEPVAEEDWDEEWEEEADEDWERRSGLASEEDEEMFALDGQIEALISSIEDHNTPESLPFRVLALVGCSVELIKAEEQLGYVEARWSRQIERMVKTISGLLWEPFCPDEIAEQALSGLLHCYQESGWSLGDLLKPCLVSTSPSPQWREWLLGLVAKRIPLSDEQGLRRLYDLAGEVQAATGNMRAALESFKKAVASPEALLELARKCQESGDSEAAVEACRLAVSTPLTPWRVCAVRSQAATILIAASERAEARSLLMANFRESPSLETARSVLDTAEVPEERQYMAAALVGQLSNSGNQILRVRLYLEADQPRSALRILGEMKEYLPELHVAVAAGIANMDIEEAVDLWTKAVHHLICRKNRSAYAEVAKALLAMRKALIHAGLRTRWQKFYWDLQDRYRSYRALQDELQQAGV